MRKLWDFHGGVHPPENKGQSCGAPIRQTSLPALLIVPLQQHIGMPAQALVTPGTRVAKGEKIAEAQGSLSVPVHAPSSGVVIDIRPHGVPHPSGLSDWCVLIEPDGEDRWTELSPCPEPEKLAPGELLRRIQDAGIAGLGGAGFPTAFKLQPPAQAFITTLILNGAECEPYITADQVLMQEQAPDLVAGLAILAQILNPSECLIAVEDNKTEAIAALQAAVEGTPFEVVAIPTRYPSGGEKQLVEILTGKQVPHAGIPADIGVLCLNVATAVAVYRAVHYGEPLISRITTVTGDAVAKPGNYRTLIGTPLTHLLEEAGTDLSGGSSNVQRLIHGGSMMGFALSDPHVPITKTSNCLIAASARELPLPPPAQACIRCGQCEQVCPMQLLPQQLYWYARSGELDKAEDLDLFDCIECGACSYVCPSTIPLVQYYRNAKGEVRQQRAEQMKADLARERFEARQRRLEREQTEKQARRQARATDTPVHDPVKKTKSAAVQAALARVQARQAGGTANIQSGRGEQDKRHEGGNSADKPDAQSEAPHSQRDLPRG